MRRVVLLALLALALPTAALATSVGVSDYGNTGSLGTTATTSGSLSVGGTFNITSQLVSIVSGGVTTTGNPLGTVSVTTGTLASCGAGCFSFTGGTIDITNTSSQTLFSGTFNGTVTVVSGVTSIIYAPGGSPVIGGFQITAAGVVSGDTIVTPEPGTLGLLGTGLVGLAGIIRRKVRG